VRTHETEALKEFLGKLLRACGTGISEVVTAENVLDWDRDLPGIPSSEREKITQLFTAQSGDASTPTTMVEIDMKGSNRFYLRQNEQGELLLLKLLLKHEGEQRQAIDFHMNDESDGTQRIIHLAPMLFDISEGRERVIVIDELDRRLHPYLSRLVVQTVLQCAFNNQLLFTTHETSLLDLELLRRDEIWFVEKNESGSSHLYSLAEFKVRPDLQIEKGYLNGRFGAVPFVGDIVSLGWNDKTDAVREYARAK
jgi:AAA15 family ATPase/GTPase